MRIERIGGSCLDTDSEVWGLDQTTWELMWAGEAAMRKSILALRQSGYELSILHLPKIQSIRGDTTGNEDMCNVEQRATLKEFRC